MFLCGVFVAPLSTCVFCLLLLHVIVIIVISHTCFVVFEICLVSWFALVVVINTIIILCFIIFGLIPKQSVFLMYCKDFLSSPCSCLKQKTHIHIIIAKLQKPQSHEPSHDLEDL